MSERPNLDHPDLRLAAAIIGGAKAEAEKTVPESDDPKDDVRRYELISAIIKQVVERRSARNGKPGANREAPEEEKSSI